MTDNAKFPRGVEYHFYWVLNLDQLRKMEAPLSKFSRYQNRRSRRCIRDAMRERAKKENG